MFRLYSCFDITNLIILALFWLRFSDLTGTDYSDGAVELAQHLSQRDGFPNIRFMV
jgi:hypothetical protein